MHRVRQFRTIVAFQVLQQRQYVPVWRVHSRWRTFRIHLPQHRHTLARTIDSQGIPREHDDRHCRPGGRAQHFTRCLQASPEVTVKFGAFHVEEVSV